MKNNLLKYTFIFIALVLVQQFVFNNIELNTYMNPYVYVLFILILPFTLNKSLLLLLSFVLGATIDLLSGTLGLHSAACTLIGYLRPYVLSIFTSREDFEQELVPTIATYGLAWFVRYSGFLIVIHHWVLFTLESFTFENYGTTIIRILLSSVLTLFFVILTEYAFSKQK
ncbi:rod shape-determining protein MreD [Acetobacteroides hydrogenigenes]|uniref:Rod shape-determining protein MreD n=1 Tax=Acetobacteroides hydrogenigenes TaxID=979970 RepID=A0A4R2F1E1_9BACT|nr:rod shape-determining protein MreD [Acetobacteroides hydrogenigenes]TCN73155.1 rod shape-determining protein MreD [Acetobacteroides hydrogenigenes]